MVERVYLLARELGIGQTLASYLGHGKHKAVAVVKRIVFCSAVVVAEYLFVEVSVEMEGFNTNVGSSEVPLQQRPEVLQPVGVYLALYIPLRVIHNVMYEAI